MCLPTLGDGLLHAQPNVARFALTLANPRDRPHESTHTCPTQPLALRLHNRVADFLC